MSAEENIVAVAIHHIRIDGGTQVREKLDDAVVEEYAERMGEGVQFPPVVVLHDGEDYWLADGFHRLHAALRRQRATIDCRVFDGGRRDAVLVALKANSTHGLRRSNADKRRAVAMVLADEEWSKKSTRWIADICGVGRELVEQLRRGVVDSTTPLKECDTSEDRRLGQDGRLHAVDRTAQPAAPATDGDAADEALRAAEGFDSCLVRLKKLAADGGKLAGGAGGALLAGSRLDDYQTNLRQAADHLAATRPSMRCMRCMRCRGAGCAHCAERGWLCAALLAGQ